MSGVRLRCWGTLAGLCLGLAGCDGPDQAVNSARDSAAEAAQPTEDHEVPPPRINPDDGIPDAQPDALSTGFIAQPDGGITAHECSLYEQECGPGEKCNVWANDGGRAWNATRCIAVDPDPDLPGEFCHVDGDRVSGIDSCDVGSFCWDVDTEGNGMCVSYCSGSENRPTCSNPNEFPAAGKEFCVCLPVCDPLLNDCPVGCGCYHLDRVFQCAPDASGDNGRFADTCEFINDCDPGLGCVNPDLIGCEGGGCCTYFCDISHIETCPGETRCTPLFERGDASAGMEDVGLCLLPFEE